MRNPFVTITALHIVLGELAPKTVALQHPERTALVVARPTEIFMRVVWPFILLLNGMGRAVVRAAGMRPPSGHSLVHSEEEQERRADRIAAAAGRVSRSRR